MDNSVVKDIVEYSSNVVQEAQNAGISQRQLAVIKKTYCKDFTDDEMMFYFSYCKSFGLVPAKHVVAFKTDNGIIRTHITIDGFRIVAERTGQYDGQSNPQWCDKEGNWKDVWVGKEMPIAAKVEVYRKDKSRPFIGIAFWEEYKSEKNMWKKMPVHMLAKCAESLALRKAFPIELAGEYTKEEMDGVLDIGNGNNGNGSKKRENIIDADNSTMPIDKIFLPPIFSEMAITLQDLFSHPNDYDYISADGTKKNGHDLLRVYTTLKDKSGNLCKYADAAKALLLSPPIA